MKRQRGFNNGKIDIASAINYAYSVGLQMNNIRKDEREPIENALYATGIFLTDEASDLADGIMTYLKEAGFKIVKANEKTKGISKRQ